MLDSGYVIRGGSPYREADLNSEDPSLVQPEHLVDDSTNMFTVRSELK